MHGFALPSMSGSPQRGVRFTRRSLHFDVFPQISRDIEVFAFDDRWLAFFKTTAGDRLELQDFLFGRRTDFSASFFLFLPRDRFLLRRNRSRARARRYGRYRGGSVEAGGSVSAATVLQTESISSRLGSFDSWFFGSNFRLRCCGFGIALGLAALRPQCSPREALADKSASSSRRRAS